MLRGPEGGGAREASFRVSSSPVPFEGAALEQTKLAQPRIPIYLCVELEHFAKIILRTVSGLSKHERAMRCLRHRASYGPGCCVQPSGLVKPPPKEPALPAVLPNRLSITNYRIHHEFFLLSRFPFSRLNVTSQNGIDYYTSGKLRSLVRLFRIYQQQGDHREFFEPPPLKGRVWHLRE